MFNLSLFFIWFLTVLRPNLGQCRETSLTKLCHSMPSDSNFDTDVNESLATMGFLHSAESQVVFASGTFRLDCNTLTS